MTWARALGEFGATIIFAGNFPGRTQTMPLAIYLGFYASCLALTWWFYLRRSPQGEGASSLAGARV